MATTWQDLSLENLEGARLLLDEGYLRSSVSRAYFAAYSAAAGELMKRKIKFARGWNNPTHEQLGELILHNLPFRTTRRLALNKAVRRLRQARESADYRPGITLTRSDALILLRDAAFVVREMGVRKHA